MSPVRSAAPTASRGSSSIARTHQRPRRRDGGAFGRAVARSDDPDVRAVPLLGSGSRFCAGGDVRAFQDALAPADYLHRLAFTTEGHLRRLSELRSPVVAGVHGVVAGAGLAFVLNADLVVAGRSTRFLAAYANIGSLPTAGLLAAAPGGRHAARVRVHTERPRADADTALDWGLISAVVDDADVEERAEELCRRLVELPTGAWADQAVDSLVVEPYP